MNKPTVTDKSIHDLKLHERAFIYIEGEDQPLWVVLRVPGGWIYQFITGANAFFIPGGAENRFKD